MNVDPYKDPATGVLRNRLNISDRDRLRTVESLLTEAAIADLDTRTVPGRYDLAHLQRFHREIFGDVYPWAGEVRVVAIAKSDLFCLPQHVAGYAADVFRDLAKEGHLRDLAREVFVDRLTHYFAEVNAIHPFREGNGRAQRAFFRQLTREAGWTISWVTADSDENVRASMLAVRGDNGPLRAVLDALVSG